MRAEIIRDLLGAPAAGAPYDRRRMRRATLAALVCAVALPACSHVHVVGADRTLSVALTEYRLRPQDVRVSAGPLSIFVHNYGRLTHNLALSIDGLGAGSTPPLLPGESTELVVYLTPGRYTMASTILSDQALGEYGTLTVTR
jgi:uncharacterized cupredoxin-like copper-binding protein